MANMCSNAMRIYGDREQLEKLHALINKAIDDTDRTNPVYLTFLLAGYSESEIKTLGMPNCYGMETDEEITTGKYGITYLCVWYESAWSPAISQWNAMLSRFFPKLKQVTISEECGNEIYINTDESGYFFPDRYYMDGQINNVYIRDELPDSGIATNEQALAFINMCCEKAGVKHDFKTIDEAMDYISEKDEESGIDEDSYLSVYEFTTKY